MKRKISFASVFVIILSCMAFANKSSTLLVSDEKFIYIIAYAGTQNNSMDNYVSGIINYNGYDACSKEFITPADFYFSAGLKFLNYLESKYGLNKYDWKLQYAGDGSMVDYPSGYFKGFETKFEAQKAKEKYLRNDSQGTLFDTDFTYKCLGSNISSTETKPVAKNKGKAYWFISYMFNNKIYVSDVFNNDCNHCNNEIKEAYKKFLVMNDYVSNPNTASMLTYHDVEINKLIERRDEQIYARKQQGYTVININFSYLEK